MAKRRRHRGESSTYRACRDSHGCPPAVQIVDTDGKTVRARPEHSKSCRAPWAYAVDDGINPATGRRKRTVITARTKVQLQAKIAALEEKRAVGVSPTAQTVGGWLDYWAKKVAPDNGVRPGTIKGYKSKIDLYLKPSLGHIKLQDVRPEHVEEMGDWMRTLDKSRLKGNHGPGPLSETTIRQAHMILRSALSDALARRKVVYNAAAVVRAPKADENPHEHLELPDAKNVLKAATSERELCRLVVALALGIRQGEALALRWADDYRHEPGSDHASLTIDEAVQRIDGKLNRTDVKSRASHRLIPIPEKMVPIFEAWREIATDNYMFPGPAGGPCDAKHDWKLWRAALVRAGVRMVPLHGARGSAASLLADMGVPDWMIAEILGHAQVMVTRRHYIEGTQESHRKALSGLIGELLP